MMIRRFAAAAALATVTLGAGAGIAGAASSAPQSSAPQSSDALSGIVADLRGILGIDRPELIPHAPVAHDPSTGEELTPVALPAAAGAGTAVTTSTSTTSAPAAANCAHTGGDADPAANCGGHATTSTPTTDTTTGTASTPTTGTRPLIASGQNAVKRVLALEEQKAGHKLMDIQFIDGNRAHISFAPEYDLQKDNDALVNVTKALQINGFSVTADR